MYWWCWSYYNCTAYRISATIVSVAVTAVVIIIAEKYLLYQRIWVRYSRWNLLSIFYRSTTNLLSMVYQWSINGLSMVYQSSINLLSIFYHSSIKIVRYKRAGPVGSLLIRGSLKYFISLCGWGSGILFYSSIFSNWWYSCLLILYQASTSYLVHI